MNGAPWRTFGAGLSCGFGDKTASVISGDFPGSASPSVGDFALMPSEEAAQSPDRSQVAQSGGAATTEVGLGPQGLAPLP